jgi:predicted RNA binding protein YcfA (HicA-like mRNA interferase family)
MEARHLLKMLKDDGWFLGDTAGAVRQYVHKESPDRITVCVRYTDELGPETLASARAPGPPRGDAAPRIAYEDGPTGVSAYSPDLPGCVATGSTRDDAEARMAEAVELHLRRTGHA